MKEWSGDFGPNPQTRISFGDLVIDDRAKGLVRQVMDSNWISGGPMVRELERTWGETFDYPYNVAVSSGTSADMAACMTLYDFGAERGDEIILPALAFAATGNSVLAAGFKPVFVDIDRKTLNINPDRIEEKVGLRTRAIMAVHTMGKPCDMDRIMEIAGKHGLRVIEDCCEAHGAQYRGQYVSSIGDVGTFSFYVAHIVACGDGGMVSTKSGEISDIVTSVKSHGRKPGQLYFDHVRYGLNFRFDDLNAAIGVSEVEKFGWIYKRRKDNLNYLLGEVRDLEEFAYFSDEGPNEEISPHAFPVTLKYPKLDGKSFYEHLQGRGVDCKRTFGSMPTQHRAFEFLGHKKGEFPEAEYVGDNSLHFGIHQHLSREDLDYASEVLHDYFKKV